MAAIWKQLKRFSPITSCCCCAKEHGCKINISLKSKGTQRECCYCRWSGLWSRLRSRWVFRTTCCQKVGTLRDSLTRSHRKLMCWRTRVTIFYVSIFIWLLFHSILFKLYSKPWNNCTLCCIHWYMTILIEGNE